MANPGPPRIHLPAVLPSFTEVSMATAMQLTTEVHAPTHALRLSTLKFAKTVVPAENVAVSGLLCSFAHVSDTRYSIPGTYFTEQ